MFRNPILFALYLIAALIVLSPWAFAQEDSAQPAPDSLDSDTSRVILSLERRAAAMRSITDTLSLSIESHAYSVAGFDLKFGTVASSLQILNVLAGKLVDSCRWDYFNASPVTIIDRYSGPPLQVWQAVGLARTGGDTAQPACFGFDTVAVLIRIVVASSESLRPQDSAPIFFIWEDCTDNAVSSQSGRSLAVSRTVFDYIPPAIPESRNPFPTFHGTPGYCLSPRAYNRPKRLVDFHNGGLIFSPTRPPTQGKSAVVKPKDHPSKSADSTSANPH